MQRVVMVLGILIVKILIKGWAYQGCRRIDTVMSGAITPEMIFVSSDLDGFGFPVTWTCDLAGWSEAHYARRRVDQFYGRDLTPLMYCIRSIGNAYEDILICISFGGFTWECCKICGWVSEIEAEDRLEHALSNKAFHARHT